MYTFEDAEVMPFDDSLPEEDRWGMLIGCLELMTRQDQAVGLDFEDARLNAKARCVAPDPEDVLALDARLLGLSLKEGLPLN